MADLAQVLIDAVGRGAFAMPVSIVMRPVEVCEIGSSIVTMCLRIVALMWRTIAASSCRARAASARRWTT